MTTVLEMSGVQLRRDDNLILRGVDWTVDSADRWVLLGPNGAGKTTLITLASARTHPSEGTVEVLGERLGEVDVTDLRIRVGLSSSALADHIPPGERVEDVVMTAAHGVTGRWHEEYEPVDLERATLLLEAFGMTGYKDREFWTLSEGERKRVQIARALMADPELLLLDEPAAGLDLGGREELLGALTELAGDRRSPAMVMVTHHVEEIPVDFTHAMLLRDGEVIAAGPLGDVLTADNLSRTYGMPVQVQESGGRWTARRGS
ncbi:ABC transporter ATP-binding protein [Demequina sp. NBRC 110054]|uniref:ABC transporter ATP-binding protein n=1 Tax=Demequina sp. NBRC 110054 TaxID=1570343 RepID=UPI0009FE8A71|nr:ABC transporter ATP-binding protein [Demequina sp. NBRC 110054]